MRYEDVFLLNLLALGALLSPMDHLSKEQIDSALQSGDRLAYRLKEVSSLIGVPVSTLRTMIRRGQLNPVTAFGTWLITAEDLTELLNRRLR